MICRRPSGTHLVPHWARRHAWATFHACAVYVCGWYKMPTPVVPVYTRVVRSSLSNALHKLKILIHDKLATSDLFVSRIGALRLLGRPRRIVLSLIFIRCFQARFQRDPREKNSEGGSRHLALRRPEKSSALWHFAVLQLFGRTAD